MHIVCQQLETVFKKGFPPSFVSRKKWLILKKERNKIALKLLEFREENMEEKKSGHSLTEGSIAKGFIFFALPLFLGSLFQQLYGTVDLIFVGNYMGKTEAAAVGASSILVTCLIGLFTGISVGAGVITAQYWGAKEEKDVRTSMENAIFLAITGGILLMIVGQLLADWALRALQTPTSILAEALVYIRIYLLAIMSMIIYNMCAGILRAMGDSRTPFLVLAAGGFLNVFMDWSFIALLDWGVAGAALATVVSQTFTAVYLLIYICKKEKLLKQRWKIERKMIGRIIKIGVPLGIQSMILTLSNLVVQYYINGFGEDAVAAFTVYFRVESMLYLPIVAFGQSIVTFAGQNYGAGNYGRIKKGALVCNVLSASVIGILSVLILVFDRPILEIFCKDESVIRLGLLITGVSFPFYFIYAIMEVTGGIVRGIGKTIQSMVIVITTLCICRVILLKIFADQFHSLKMVAAVYPITWMLAMTAFIVCFLKVCRKQLN